MKEKQGSRRQRKDSAVGRRNRKNDSTSIVVRWMIRRDLPAVLDIEQKCFEFPWQEEDFLVALRQRNVIGMVAERNERITGFMIYERHKKRLHLLSMAVHPSHSRQGIGSTLIQKLVSKLSTLNRSFVQLEVRETNLRAQLFFKSMGFQAVEVLREFYRDTDCDCSEDAYLMRFRVSQVTV